jgi:hypothetical protein
MHTPLLKFIQMLQPRQHNLFTRLFNLSSQEDFIQNSINLFPTTPVSNPFVSSSPFPLSYLVKVKHQIQFTHIAKELI